MKKNISLALALLLSWGVFAQEKETLAEIETSLGTMVVKLYNDTPRHRDNFIRLAKEGHYDGTLFYRVIKEFMIQGGSSDSRNARPGQVLGYGKEVTIPAEFRPGHYHKKGALAAPRQPDNMNMDKDSDISQFYIVQGKKYTATELENYIKSINVPIKRKIQEKYYYPKKPLLDRESERTNQCRVESQYGENRDVGTDAQGLCELWRLPPLGRGIHRIWRSDCRFRGDRQDSFPSHGQA